MALDAKSDLMTVERDLTAPVDRVASVDIDTLSRIALQKAAQKLSLALETPGDSFQRMAFLPLQLAVVRIGLDLKLFKNLQSAGSRGLTLGELAKKTAADPVLLNRLLKCLVVAGVVDQKDETDFVANAITKCLCTTVSDVGVRHYFDSVSPVFFKLPEYLAKTQYRNPDDGFDGPFQFAYDTKLHPFVCHEDRADWLDWFPFQDRVASGIESGPDAVSFVDVGGSQGSELKRLSEKYPNLPGRLILQDTESVIKGLSAGAPFEAIVHDFFTPQPVQGARVYYFRNVLHDWPEDKCREILKNTMSAMKSGYSKIIINEMVVKDQGAGWTETSWDMTMMPLSSQERTETQWRELIESVGLKVSKIWWNVSATESIIEVELA